MDGTHYLQLKDFLRQAGYNNWYAHPSLILSQSYPLYIEYIEGCACIFTADGELFIPPLGAGEKAFLALKRIEMEQDFFSDIMCHFWHGDLTHNFHGDWEFKLIDENYINDIETVIGLQGKKLKVLRHNVNHFEYKTTILPTPYSHEHRDDVLKLFEDCKSEDEFNDDYNERMLDFIEIDNCLFATCFFIGTELVAFNLGGKLNETTAIYIINKNRQEYKFLVDYVRYLFHLQCFNLGFKYVNDGSDLEREGLQRLKKKFKPVKRMPIYQVVRSEAQEE